MGRTFARRALTYGEIAHLGTTMAGYKMRLFNAVAPAISPDMALANFTETIYSGYAAQLIGAMAGPRINQLGDAEVWWPLLAFHNDGGGTADTVLGWYITNEPATFVALAGMFDTPYPMVDATSQLLIVPRVSLPLTSYGGFVIPEV
jgi:hypothetical protein